MTISLCIIITVGLVYLARQRVKQVRKYQLDTAAEFAGEHELPGDLVCVLRSDGVCCLNGTGILD